MPTIIEAGRRPPFRFGEDVPAAMNQTVTPRAAEVQRAGDPAGGGSIGPNSIGFERSAATARPAGAAARRRRPTTCPWRTGRRRRARGSGCRVRSAQI